MKRIISLILILAMCTCLFACNSSANLTKREIELNADNFNEYFYSNLHPEMETKTSALGTTYFVHSIRISFDLNQTAAIKNITVKGRLELNVPKTHLFYTEGKLPIEFSANINGNGHGETTVHFQHGTGSYGGFSTGDYYIVIESVTGLISPDN